jgi:hypothetical protein
MNGAASAYHGRAADVPADLPHLIASGVSTSVETAAAAIAPISGTDFEATAPDGAKVVSKNGVTVATAASGATVVASANGKMRMVGPSGGVVEIYPPDAHGHRRAVLTGPDGGTVTYADARAVPALAAAIAAPPAPPAPPPPPGTRAHRSAIDRAIAMKAVGVTPEYVAAMKSALPQLNLTAEDLVGMKGVGVTPDFIQELARQGYRNVDPDDVTGAYAVGVRADYIRAMAAAGYPRLSLEQLTELRAVGVTPADVQRYRRAGFTHIDVDQLVQVKTLGITPEELRAGQRDP